MDVLHLNFHSVDRDGRFEDSRETNDDIVQLLTQRIYDEKHGLSEESAIIPSDLSNDRYAKVMELVEKACAELDPVLDVIGFLEKGEVISVDETQYARGIAPGSSAAAERETVGRVHTKQKEIACVADLLDAAAEECQKRIGRSARFRTDLRQLQAAWRLSPAPSRAAPGGGAEYPIVAHVQLQDGVDLKHPDAEQLASEEQVTIVAGPEGAVRVQAGATHRQADGLEAVEALLTSKQEDFIRAAVALRLRAEAGAMAETDAGSQLFLLEDELQALLRRPRELLGSEDRALVVLCERLFLESLESRQSSSGASIAGHGSVRGTSVARESMPRADVLPRVMEQLQHAAAVRATHAGLCQTLQRLRSLGDLAQLLQMHTGEPCVTAWEMEVVGLPPLTVVVRGMGTFLDGVRCTDPGEAPAPCLESSAASVPSFVLDACCKRRLEALAARLPMGIEVVHTRRQVLIRLPRQEVTLIGHENGSVTATRSTASGGVAEPVNLSGFLQAADDGSAGLQTRLEAYVDSLWRDDV